MTNKETIDLQLLQEYIDMLGVNTLVEMLSLYQESLIEYLTDIENALTNVCQQTWYECCHKLKGATSSMGFVELTQFLTDIQHKAPLECVQQDYINNIKSMSNQAVECLKTWLKDK